MATEPTHKIRPFLRIGNAIWNKIVDSNSATLSNKIPRRCAGLREDWRESQLEIGLQIVAANRSRISVSSMN